MDLMRKFIIWVVLAGSWTVHPAHAQSGSRDPSIDLAGTEQIRIGMPLREAIARFSLEQPQSPGEASCAVTSYNYPPIDVSLLAINGVVVRLRFEAQYDNIPEISYRTPEGLRLGSTLREVRQAFPNAEERVEQNGGRMQIYAWSRVDHSGYLFEVSPQSQRVVAIAVGNESLRWYEDCV